MNTKPILGYVKCISGEIDRRKGDDLLPDTVYPYIKIDDIFTYILNGDEEQRWYSHRFIEVPPPASYLFEY